MPGRDAPTGIDTPFSQAYTLSAHLYVQKMKPNLPGTDPTSLGDRLADRLAANLAAEGRLPHQAFPSRREIGQRMKAPLARVNIAFDILHRRGLLSTSPLSSTMATIFIRLPHFGHSSGFTSQTF